MNIKAMESMEAFAEAVLNAGPTRQARLWETLKDALPAEDVIALQKCVGIYHLFTDQQLYSAAMKAIHESLTR